MNDSLQGNALDELIHEGRYLYPTNVVEIVERYHAGGEPGVPRSLVLSYADHVLSDLGNRAPYSLTRFSALLDDRVTDAAFWLPNALYRTGPDRISVYPLSWHQRLDGVTDPVEYATVVGADLDRARGIADAGVASAVPKQLLLDAMTVMGPMDRRTAGGLLRDARLSGRIRVDPVQNPDADVRVVPAPAPASSGRSEPTRSTASGAASGIPDRRPRPGTSPAPGHGRSG
ncbi:hypothetical protein SAMN05216559_2169 [Halomicrobium zhouii]|uniref:Uncharacterized protein n=1 Tax=Halomicrobium zhouii TaxID=767519 RepID=A0A1I6L6S5_9EURY|nr:hypothetical protein [Halomicrobium zhouii]SFR99201.1 hypothetical protein SAMN05216559_2169 [Halomicrobium zhouii]